MDIGGRQVTVDEHGRITYVSPSAAAIAKALRLSINEGDPADEAVLSRLCDGMAEVLEEMLGAAEPTELLEEAGLETPFKDGVLAKIVENLKD